MGDVFETRRLSTTKYNVVLRQVHHSELPEKSPSNLFHLAAFHPHGFGTLIGYISICPKRKVVHCLKTLAEPDELVTALLLKDSSGWLKVSSFELSSELPQEKAVLISSMLVGDRYDIKESIPSSSSSSSSGVDIDTMWKSEKRLTVDSKWRHAHKLSMTLSVFYKPRLAGHGHEVPYGVYIYPTFSFSRGDPVFMKASEIATPYTTTLVFDCETPYLPNSAKLNFDVHAEMKNQSEVMCVNQAGYTNVRIADLAGSLGKRFVQTVSVPNSKRKQSKGQIILVCTAITLDGKAPSPAPPNKHKKKDKSDYDIIDSYITNNYQFYESRPPRFPSIATLSIFVYASRRGKIPGCMFDVFRLPDTKEEFYLNALKIAIRRMRPFDAVDVSEFMRTASKEDRIVAVMSMLCIFVNWCDYITDEVDNNTEDSPYSPSNVELIESFDTMTRIRNAGDCEDFVKEILMEVAEIKYNSGSFVSDAMRGVREILADFIVVSVLCGVSNASISFSAPRSSEKLNGHECAMAVPKYIFFKALSRGPLGKSHPLLSLYSQEEQNMGKDLSICVLEGTGNLHPCSKVQSSTSSSITDLLLDELPDSITEPLKKQFFFSPGGDNFYKVFLTWLTSEPFLEKGYRGFEFLVCTTLGPPPPNTSVVVDGNSSNATRGVPFIEILEIDNHPNNHLAESPTITLKTFHAASKIDHDNFPSMMLNPAPSPDFSVSPEEIPSNRPSVDEMAVFQISFKAATPEYLSVLSSKISSLNLRMMKIPEYVKLDTETNRLIGGYSLFVFR